MKIVDVKTYPTVYPVKQPFSNGMRTTRQRPFGIVEIITDAGITGWGSTVIVGTSAAYVCATPGGVWSSSNTAVATIDAGTGALTIVGVGASTITATQAAAGNVSNDAGVGALHLSAHRAKSVGVKVDRTTTKIVTAGESHFGPTGAGNEGAQHHDGRSHRRNELLGGDGRQMDRHVNRDDVIFDRHVTPQSAQKMAHRVDVGDVRGIEDAMPALGEQAGSHLLQNSILRPPRSNRSRVPSFLITM